MAETTFHTTFSTSQFLLSRANNGSESGFWSAVSYRFGFQGQEQDNEIKGDGNSLEFEYRIYDSRLGRFLSVDPLSNKYPYYTPYSFAGNKPIKFIDLEGLEEGLPWYLSENKYGGKPVLTFGLGNLATYEKLEYGNYPWYSDQAILTFASNTTISAWNNIATFWNDALDGKTGTQMMMEMDASINSITYEDLQKVEFWENFAGTFLTAWATKKVCSTTPSLINGYKIFKPKTLGTYKVLKGEFVVVNESMSTAAKTYQSFVTGRPWNESYLLNGTKFDGYINGILVDAKSGYSSFVSKATGEFYDWFSGKQSLLSQARRQIAAADGNRIRWVFQNENVMEATRVLFEQYGIDGIELMCIPN